MNSSIPETFPTASFDRYTSAMFSPKCDIMLQVEMIFDHRLDCNILRNALDLALDAEPILGCRFSLENGKAVWKRLPVRDRNNFRHFCREEEFNQYRNETLDSNIGPALRGAVFNGQTDDHLLLKVAHEAADAGGAKDAAYLVASLYRKLKKDPSYLPVPNISGSRDMDQVMKHIPAAAMPRIWFSAFKEMLSWLLRREVHNPFNAPINDLSREYIVRVISPERMSIIKKFSSDWNAKINDILLAAFLRSLSRTGWNGKSQLWCAMTVDLRKWYIPGGKAEAIANLSGLEFVSLCADPGNHLSDTLRKVVSFTASRKKNWIGLNLPVGLGKLLAPFKYDMVQAVFMQMQRKDVKAKAILPGFTNMGSIDHDKLCFESVPQDARIMVPAAFPPFFIIGISGYRDSLTVSTAAYPETKEKVNMILDYMIEELP